MANFTILLYCTPEILLIKGRMLPLNGLISFQKTHMFSRTFHHLSSDSSRPVSTMVTTTSLYKICAQHVTMVNNLLHSKIDSIMPYPAVSWQFVTLLACMSYLNTAIRRLAWKPHQAKHKWLRTACAKTKVQVWAVRTPKPKWKYTQMLSHQRSWEKFFWHFSVYTIELQFAKRNPT